MRHAIAVIGAVVACLTAAACYGPDEAASTLSVAIRYATSSDTQLPGDPGARGQVDPNAPFIYSLDQYPVVAILDVSGAQMQAMSVPVYDDSGAAANTGVITADVNGIPSGESVTLMVEGFAVDVTGIPAGFALSSARTVNASGPLVNVDLQPEAMVSGTIAVQVMRGGAAVSTGDVFIVDEATSIAFPALSLTSKATVGNGLEIAGVPLDRSMHMFYRDAPGGSYADGGSFTLTQAWESKTFSF